jgi:hypothetical protein
MDRELDFTAGRRGPLGDQLRLDPPRGEHGGAKDQQDQK